jgi:site-specific recombinase XerC
MLQQLPNNCSCSTLSVFPKTWRRANAPVKKDWYIHYRFYDPTELKPKKVIIKGMNHERSAEKRRHIAEVLLENEWSLLKKGYNAFTGKIFVDEKNAGHINEELPFMKALEMAHEGLICTPETKADIKSVLKYTRVAVTALEYDQLPIGEVRKKHIKTIFVKLSKTKKVWTANQFNHFRKYLGILFTELMEYIDLEYNPAYAIKRQKTIKRIRKTLTREERKKIDKKLKETNYYFWRFMQIFFHSGARESELLMISKLDVDLEGQRYKATIIKGKTRYETWKPIKDIVLDLWKEVMSEAGKKDFIFSKNLRPGDVSIHPHQISRRWRVHVKEKMGITADFYSLKHSNLDETAAALSLQDAAGMASHTTPVITMDYAIGEKERQMNRLKGVKNSFA